MSDIQIVSAQEVQRRIYTIRGIQVVLDKDLAEFYEVKPIRLREQVKRNIKRFPSDFMFQLSNDEVEFMVSQNAIPSRQHLGGFLPYVFTEQGVAAVSSVLSSERAINVSIQIMRAFVSMRRFFAANATVFQRLGTIEQKQLESDQKFKEIFDALEKNQIVPGKGVFFDGQVFDAHVLVSRIIRSAKKSIAIIDNYIDETVLTLLDKRKKSIPAKIYTKSISKQLQLDIGKHNQLYSPITVKTLKTAHDRFLIIDDKTVYHFGASLKDLGKKWFAFAKMDKEGLKIVERLK